MFSVAAAAAVACGMRNSTVVFAVCSFVSLGAAAEDAPAPAEADGAERAEAKEGHDEADKGENGIAIRVLGGGSHVGAAEVTEPLVGVGIAYERAFFDDLIAVEIALEALTTPVSSGGVVELVVEKPVELSDDVGFYFGAGPTFGVESEEGRFFSGVGGLGLVGVEWRLVGDLHAFAELDTAFFLYAEPVVESDLGLGLQYRF